MYRNEFTVKRQCLIEQYSAYRDPITLKNLDGKRIVSENIADLTGIKLAYNAYKKWNSEFNDTRHNLIGVDFTQNQLFWIVMAQNWCGIFREGKFPLAFFPLRLQFEYSCSVFFCMYCRGTRT
jgi:predicted metalloendopeptidase